MNDLTLIIPIRGRFELAKATLASVEAQERLPERLVIVDNGSEPPVSEALAGEIDRLRAKMPVTLADCPTPGAPNARNAGLELADTEWTMFFDSDDIMQPSHIALAMAAAEANPEAAIVGWDAELTDSNGKRLRMKKFPTSDYLFNAVMHGSLATQCYMARTRLFREAGSWNPEAEIWNDVELSVRLLRRIGEERIVKTVSGLPTVRIITHANSITGSNFSDGAEKRDHTLDIINGYADDQRTVAILALKRAILAGCCAREGNKEMAKALYTKAIAMPISAFQRMAVRFAYRFTAIGLPGAARIVRIFNA